MELRSDQSKLTFIVDTRCTIGLENKGGSIALHKLAYELAVRDNYVYIFNTPRYPHSNIKTIPTELTEKFDGGWVRVFNWEPFNFNINRTISIYPQITPYKIGRAHV